MKSKFLRQKMLLFALITTTALRASSQKIVTIISSKENNYCNGTCTLLNIPELSNNPNAIIMVTPIAEGSHPIAAYYIKLKKDTLQWSILNLDNAVMQSGTQFRVQYYTQPDTTHFVHIVTRDNLKKQGSYIDHEGLNNNPNAQIQFFQNLAPAIRGGIANNYDLKIQYDTDAGKWYMFNNNTQPLGYATAYNIAFSPGTYSSPKFDTAVTSVSSNAVKASKNIGPGQSIWITVTGAKQGLFKGESSGKVLGNRIMLTSFEMEVTSGSDILSGLSTGKKNYTPILIQKTIGPTSLQFLQALISNENLTKVTIEVLDANNKPAYTIILINAHVNSCKHSFTNGKDEPIDLIKLTFQKIEFDYSSPAIQVLDDWNPPNL